MAIKVGNTLQYLKNKNRGGTLTAAPINYTDGVFGTPHPSMTQQQQQFISNMHNDPEMTIGTALGGLLGSIIGNTVHENGVRKGTEEAQKALDELGITQSSPGIDFMRDYFKPYAGGDENAHQTDKDIMSMTGAISESQRHLFDNATPEQYANAIKQQAIANGRTPVQVARIMESVTPQIDAAYNKYNEAQDAWKYAAAAEKVKEGDYQGALKIAPMLKDQRYANAINNMVNYNLAEQNYAAKMAAAMNKGGAAGKSGTKTVDEQPPAPNALPAGVVAYTDLDPRFSDFIGSPSVSTKTPGYNPDKKLIPSAGPNDPEINAHTVRLGIKNYKDGIVDYNKHPELLKTEAETIAGDIQNALLPELNGFAHSIKDVVSGDRYLHSIKDPVVQAAVRDELIARGVMQPSDNGVAGIVSRFAEEQKDLDMANADDRDIAAQYKLEQNRRNAAIEKAKVEWLKNNRPEQYNIYTRTGGRSGFSMLSPQDIEEQTTWASTEQNYNPYLSVR